MRSKSPHFSKLFSDVREGLRSKSDVDLANVIRARITKKASSNMMVGDTNPEKTIHAKNSEERAALRRLLDEPLVARVDVDWSPEGRPTACRFKSANDTPPELRSAPAPRKMQMRVRCPFGFAARSATSRTSDASASGLSAGPSGRRVELLMCGRSHYEIRRVLVEQSAFIIRSYAALFDRGPDIRLTDLSVLREYCLRRDHHSKDICPCKRGS